MNGIGARVLPILREVGKFGFATYTGYYTKKMYDEVSKSREATERQAVASELQVTISKAQLEQQLQDMEKDENIKDLRNALKAERNKGVLDKILGK